MSADDQRDPATARTVVHVLRHGEVNNPTGVLYGRLPDFHLSDIGRQMAQRVASVVADRDITVVTASPLERAQETAEPIAASHELTIGTDDNLIEATNVFEGLRVGVGDCVLKHPKYWHHLRNPFKPSWGEPYVDLAARMRVAITSAREAAVGHEALLVSHQLPIWIARLDAEKHRFAHDPRHRQCALASLTSYTYVDDQLISIVYTEPAADLVAKAKDATARGA